MDKTLAERVKAELESRFDFQDVGLSIIVLPRRVPGETIPKNASESDRIGYKIEIW